ncbi:MAG TPA: ATP-dependent DNA helicase RecG [Cyclobacteriaceae bacterium]|nr:ATP-dependent DNA helicase RecG [Cyclobacteriaceae bacterium]
MSSFFDTPIEYLKGVGPQRAALLQKELNIFTFGDLIQHYPHRYDDRTKFYAIKELNDELANVQLKGKLIRADFAGSGFKKRLVAKFSDDTGSIELVWFQGVKWIAPKLIPGNTYIVFGKPQRFGNKINIAHPEIEPLTTENEKGSYLQPVYPLTEQLRNRHMDNKLMLKLQKALLILAKDYIHETLPQRLIDRYKLTSKKTAIINIHFPKDNAALKKASYRLKFEELFYVQLKLLKLKHIRQEKYKGFVFTDSTLITKFYNEHLPFDLTNAQKRVIKEIYADMKSGVQMNRLLQGDVGSGKTIVAFICMLQAIASNYQVALMAPTEILAQQHFTGLKAFADAMQIPIALLTGSTKKSARTFIHDALQSNQLKILVGTHALIENEVQFKQLGMAVIDEQHRFGVAQRSKLWQKNENLYPHVLVMTATPIPRTLAMTLYGDLEISVIDELPAGRKPIKTIHQYDNHRLKVNGFIREQIEQGRQVYVVYPLIEESEKLDLKDLMDGYESICRAFPDLPVSILHGKMKAEAKQFEMARFVKGETKIMVATTVIEVGVNVPNASVMIIENAERFGLSQLHQLRGRVGRGAAQSFCILMSSHKLSAEARIRIQTMVKTNDGFEIAEQDLKLRGPGDLMGTQQSGVLDLMLADLSKDAALLKEARFAAQAILAQDPELNLPENEPVARQISGMKSSMVNWSKIS